MRPTLAILFVLSIFISCVEETPQYTISTTADPVEGGTISPASGTHDEGTQLSFEATPNDGYHFERWSGALTGTSNPQAHTLTQDVSLTAHFALTDTTPPVITLDPLSQLINQGDPYTPPTVTATDDMDGDLTESIVIGGDTVDTNTLGTYEVTYDVTDAAGNSAEQQIHTATVALNPNGDDDGDGVINFNDQCPNTPADTIVDDTGCEDTTPPVISVDPASQVVLKGDDYVAPTVTATDNVDGDLTSSIETSGEADVDTNTKGTYTLTYTVSDTAGNTATATHTITVTDNPNADDDGDGVSNGNDHCPNTPADTIVDDTGCPDTTAPEITVSPAEQTIEIGIDTYTEPTVTETDNSGETLTATQGGDTVDTNTLGTYVVTYTATDSSGNTASATHTVTVTNETTYNSETATRYLPISFTVGDANVPDTDFNLGSSAYYAQLTFAWEEDTISSRIFTLATSGLFYGLETPLRSYYLLRVENGTYDIELDPSDGVLDSGSEYVVSIDPPLDYSTRNTITLIPLNTQAMHTVIGGTEGDRIRVTPSLSAEAQAYQNPFEDAQRVIIHTEAVTNLTTAGGTLTVNGTEITVSAGDTAADIISSLEANATISALDSISFVADEGAVILFAKVALTVVVSPN